MATTTFSKNKAPASQGLNGRKFSKAKEIAFRLDICTKTIIRWADEGKLSRHRINAQVVLLDENEVVPPIDSSRVSS